MLKSARITAPKIKTTTTSTCTILQPHRRRLSYRSSVLKTGSSSECLTAYTSLDVAPQVDWNVAYDNLRGSSYSLLTTSNPSPVLRGMVVSIVLVQFSLFVLSCIAIIAQSKIEISNIIFIQENNYNLC